jgi:dTDP-4-amino-4,6-dideoxygalactose transaminase
MDSVQGAVLSVKLKRLAGWNAARLALARRYDALLAGLPVTRPTFYADSESAWHLYVIEHPDRDGLRQKLSALGVETGLHYPVPVHLQKAYAGLGHRRGDFPVSERLADACLSLPLYPELASEQVDAVAAAIRQVAV